MTTPTFEPDPNNPQRNPAPAPKPKMTDEELRLQCVTLAVQARALPAALVSTAQAIMDFVKSGS